MTTYSVGWCEHDARGESRARRTLQQIPALAAVNIDSLPVLKCQEHGYPEIKVFCHECYAEGVETLKNKRSDFMLVTNI